MRYHKIECPKCGCEILTLSVTPHGFYLFATCDFCNDVFMFSLDWINPTNDNEMVRRKAILFRRFNGN